MWIYELGVAARVWQHTDKPSDLKHSCDVTPFLLVVIYKHIIVVLKIYSSRAIIESIVIAVGYIMGDFQPEDIPRSTYGIISNIKSNHALESSHWWDRNDWLIKIIWLLIIAIC